MGKKHRERLTKKKNNHIPMKDIISEEEAHAKEHSAERRKR
ncbi:hypothetical protein [Litchfieldia alkalitelluris]|nr:hypothetical protein [Litchfieldia alkalitelluris]